MCVSGVGTGTFVSGTGQERVKCMRERVGMGTEACSRVALYSFNPDVN